MPLICDWMKVGGASVTAQGASRAAFLRYRQIGNLLRQPVLVLDHPDGAAHLDDGIVPGRHDLAGLALGLVPGRRHIGVGALEDDQHGRCRIVGQQAPVRIGLRQMGAQPAVRRHIGVEQERDRVGDRSLGAVGDQQAQRMRPDQPVQDVRPRFPGNEEARTSPPASSLLISAASAADRTIRRPAGDRDNPRIPRAAGRRHWRRNGWRRARSSA